VYSYHQGTHLAVADGRIHRSVCLCLWGRRARQILENIELKFWNNERQAWDVKGTKSWFDSVQTWQAQESMSPEILNGDATEPVKLIGKVAASRLDLAASIETLSMVYPQAAIAQEPASQGGQRGVWYQIVTRDFKSPPRGRATLSLSVKRPCRAWPGRGSN